MVLIEYKTGPVQIRKIYSRIAITPKYRGHNDSSLAGGHQFGIQPDSYDTAFAPRW